MLATFTLRNCSILYQNHFTIKHLIWVKSAFIHKVKTCARKHSGLTSAGKLQIQWYDDCYVTYKKLALSSFLIFFIPFSTTSFHKKQLKNALIKSNKKFIIVLLSQAQHNISHSFVENRTKAM